MAEAKSLKDLMRVRAHNRAFLDSLNGTLGTAVGFKKSTDEPVSEQPAIIVFVLRKINPKWIPSQQLIPDELTGPGTLWCALDVVEGSRAEEESPVPQSPSELAERLRGWDGRVWAGSQIAHWTDEAAGEYSVGTLGAFAKERHGDRNFGLLTNQHVGVEPGKKLYHPVPWGTHLGTTHSTLTWVADQDWYGTLVDEPAAYVRVDCAFVALEPSFNQADTNKHLMGVGKLGAPKKISLNNMSIIGQKVLRVGRTTGLRRGRIVAFGYEHRDEANVTVYTDLLIVGDDGIPFSTHGDSGSLIVTDDSAHRPIGLLWGGEEMKLRTGYAQENWTYGIALTRVLDALDIDLVRT